MLDVYFGCPFRSTGCKGRNILRAVRASNQGSLKQLVLPGEPASGLRGLNGELCLRA